MGMLQNVTVSLSVLFIIGCAAPEVPPPKKTVFDPLTQQIDRAREVQKTVDEHADALRKTVDTQERGDTSP
jgi:hypothetical protein